MDPDSRGGELEVGWQGEGLFPAGLPGISWNMGTTQVLALCSAVWPCELTDIRHLWRLATVFK